MIVLLLSCTSEPTPEPVDTGTETVTAESGLVPLSDTALARRISLDLRGVLPDVADLEAVEADPAALEGLIASWMVDPLLEERMVSLYSERFQTRLEEFETRYFDYALDPSREFEFERDVADEPLRLIARVIAEDRPYAEIVTADWTMASPLLGEIWPLAREEGEGWQPAQYTDGRPAAGILATNGLWWRYLSAPTNKNRSRAGIIMDRLLCEDVLNRPISFSGSGSIDVDIDTLIWQDPACQSCHSTLDPLAASLFGFYWYIQYNKQEMTTYHPEREVSGEEILEVDMAWFGQPLGGLHELGGVMAADPRFSWCVAQTAAELMWRRPIQDAADFAAIAVLEQAYQETGRMKPVLEAVIAGDTYQAGGVTDEADEATIDRERAARMLSPDQLHSVVEALTGFRWEEDGFDQLGNDTWGYRVLAGGVDGATLTAPQPDPGVTWTLVVERLSQGAASYAVSQAATGSPPPILEGVTLTAPPDVDTLERLHFWLLGVRADADWLEAAGELWSAAEAQSDADTAWAAVLEVLMRDPDFVSR
ncbi:MAG: hypothetical protein ACI8RZ_007268 [Myxococcota bacterium]